MTTRLSKIYTKVGDKGMTMLASGAKVSKASMRIEAYGTVDELNAVIGMLRDTLVRDISDKQMKLSSMGSRLLLIQNELFDVGGELSTPTEQLRIDRQQVVTQVQIKRLEDEMDQANEHLEPLANFVLPGGHIANSTAHLARTVCRRAERCVVALAEQETVREDVRIYLNRLSDWLFVLCREISHELQIQEVLWKQNK